MTRRCSIRMVLGTKEALAQADYNALVKASLRKLFPQVEGRPNLRQLYALVSSSASFELQRRLADEPAKLGTTEKVSATCGR